MKIFSRSCGLKVAMLWGVTVAVATLLMAGPVAAQQSAGYAFAKIRGSDGAVLTCGSDRNFDLDRCTATRIDSGTYTVSFVCGFFFCTFRTSDDVVVNTTAESGTFVVSNATVSLVDFGQQIDVTVFTWVSNTGVLTDNNFFISLFVRQ